LRLSTVYLVFGGVVTSFVTSTKLSYGEPDISTAIG